MRQTTLYPSYLTSHAVWWEIITDFPKTMEFTLLLTVIVECTHPYKDVT